MKLSDYKGEEAFAVLGELLEPASRLLSDKKVAEVFKSGKPKILIAKEIMANHSKDLIEILAILNRVEVAEYKNKSMVGILADVMSLFNDEELISFFMSQASQN